MSDNVHELNRQLHLLYQRRANSYVYLTAKEAWELNDDITALEMRLSVAKRQRTWYTRLTLKAAYWLLAEYELNIRADKVKVARAEERLHKSEEKLRWVKEFILREGKER